MSVCVHVYRYVLQYIYLMYVCVQAYRYEVKCRYLHVQIYHYVMKYMFLLMMRMLKLFQLAQQQLLNCSRRSITHIIFFVHISKEAAFVKIQLLACAFSFDNVTLLMHNNNCTNCKARVAYLKAIIHTSKHSKEIKPLGQQHLFDEFYWIM